MKKLLFLLMILVALLSACSSDGDDEPVTPAIALQFVETSYTVDEDQKEIEIKIIFKEEVQGDVTINFKSLTDDLENPAIEDTHFEIVGVTKVGSKEALLKVNIIDDEDSNDDREVYLEIVESEDYEIGGIGRCKLLIIDNDMKVADDHPLKAYVGNYTATVVHKTEDSETFTPEDDKDGDNWNIKVEVSNDDFGVFYLSGIRNTSTKLTCEVSEDFTWAKIPYGSPIISAYSDYQLDGVPLKDAESPLASIVIEDDTKYMADVVIEIRDNQLYIEHLVIGLTLDGETYAVQEVELTMNKNQ